MAEVGVGEAKGFGLALIVRGSGVGVVGVGALGCGLVEIIALGSGASLGDLRGEVSAEGVCLAVIVHPRIEGVFAYAKGVCEVLRCEGRSWVIESSACRFKNLSRVERG